MNHRSIFGSMMVRMGDADALVSGITKNYPETLRPALQVIGVREGIHKVCGIYLFITRKGDLYFLADATVNIEPTAEDLAEIAICTAQEARRFDIEPRIAMLSFSNFGSTRHPLCEKVRRAAELVRYADPTLDDRRRNAGRLCSQRQETGRVIPVLDVERRSQCSDLPRPSVVQHRMPGCCRIGRRRGAGSNPFWHGEARSSVAARR